MQQCRAGDVAALHAHAVRAAGLLSPNRAAPTIGVATQPIGDFMTDKLTSELETRAQIFALKTLITAMLRAAHGAEILDLREVAEILDASFDTVASQLPIGGDAARMMARGLEIAQSVVADASQDLPEIPM